MNLFDRIRAWFRPTAEAAEAAEAAVAEEPPLLPDEDPFDAPVILEIRDVIDLHPIPPKQVRAVVEAYLIEARARGFRFVRLIHGKGIGVQREAVRAILDRTPFVAGYHDAPPDAGGLGATIAELNHAKRLSDDEEKKKNGTNGTHGTNGARVILRSVCSVFSVCSVILFFECPNIVGTDLEIPSGVE